MKIKCADFIIFKIKVYADNTNDITQQWERAQTHIDFIWNFIEKLTQKNSKYWHSIYRIDARVCAMEYILENII